MGGKKKADINTQRLHRKESSPKTKTYRSNIFIYSEDKIISTVTKTTKLAIETKKKEKKKVQTIEDVPYSKWNVVPCNN